MKTKNLLYLISLLLLVNISSAQTETNVQALKSFAEAKSTVYWEKKAEAIDYANRNNIPVTFQIGQTSYELQYIDEFGRPQYYKTMNAVSAETISTDQVHPGGGAGLNLDGTGIVLRIWDEGIVVTLHQEFTGRAFFSDVFAIPSQHATHVAGTLIAAGIDPAAKGMAYNATLLSFDWNYDIIEMAEGAALGALLSNHSYGQVRGWEGNDEDGWVWYGNPDISTDEDYLFGFYDEMSADWDDVAHDAPYYLICVAAGNDRDDTGDGTYPPDGPYDCINPTGIAKNVLTVGAVQIIPGGYNGPSSVVMTSLSSWGPADDGRIKPDIVAAGDSLWSCDTIADDAYMYMRGTSMAAPSVTGSMALLQQHYENLHGTGNFMLASTLKALVIHTADEAGSSTGPDYEFGWGLMNTEKAALKITEDLSLDVIREFTISQGESYDADVFARGTEPLKVTIVWTDHLAMPPDPQLDPPDHMIVNDLDLRVIAGGTTYYPYKLDKNNPSNAATTNSKNAVDNVEMVYIDTPSASVYNIIVDYDGVFIGPQTFSMILSGIQSCNYDLLLQDETVAIGETRIEQASNTVTVAGDGHYFVVEGNGTTGGNLTVTAGTIIHLLPGFEARSGSQVHAFLRSCDPAASSPAAPGPERVK